MARRVEIVAKQFSGSSENAGGKPHIQSSDSDSAAENFRPCWLKSTLQRWEGVWGVSDFGCHVKVVFNHRLKRSLGRCDVKTSTVRLNQICKTLRRQKLLEILCHEAAHIAVHQIYGGVPKPHGVEWQQLVRAAGFEPFVTVRRESPCNTSPISPKNKTLYQHRCPVCQTCRTSLRPVRRWRCATCAELGLEGRLIITRAVKGRT